MWRIFLALGIVYVVWGSTYLAIRVAVADLPPFLMAGGRWLLAGAILLAIGLATRQPWPSRREMAGAGAVGAFLLLGGNGLVVWAEQFIPSGLAALLVGSLPLWVLALEACLPGFSRPSGLGLTGILIGFAGVALLLGPASLAGLGEAVWAQSLVLVGTALWAVGTLVGKRVPLPAAGLYNSAFMALPASAVFLVAGLALGEGQRFAPAEVPFAAWGALAYLVVFGSCVAFSAFAWLLKHAKPELVSTYAYVNPVVAVFLGAWLLKEPLSLPMAAGAGLIVASVALVIRGGRRRPAAG